ncbi:hypothetical protein [Reticulibacter mediterranei]|uniref:hypothetical protein n=1 Tax=Reticulibacter mediterranei TaxID=2778369 RepID=UPI001C68C59A|nr:hypothetical protein [Reticulibacter mediterranei]
MATTLPARPNHPIGDTCDNRKGLSLNNHKGLSLNNRKGLSLLANFATNDQNR